MLSSITEIRKVRTVTSKELFFSIIGIKPIIGIQQDNVRIE